MRKKTALCAAVALAMTIVAVSVWHLGHVVAAPASLRGGWKPEPSEGYSGAATIWISCEQGNEFGLTIYPLHFKAGEASDLAPEPAMFAHCRPEENFNYDVQSTKSEIAESIRRSEVSFVLTEAGLVRDAFISRSSGSKSLDQKVLAIVVNRKYEATRCGSCRVFVAPPVNLKKEIR
jgi:TonB family protein